MSRRPHLIILYKTERYFGALIRRRHFGDDSLYLLLSLLVYTNSAREKVYSFGSFSNSYVKKSSGSFIFSIEGLPSLLSLYWTLLVVD